MIYVLGGSSDVNFKVVGGIAQPSNPKENTIWINTDVEIERWIIGDFPSPNWDGPDGQVVIYSKASTSGTSNAINAVKKNELWILTLYAYQRVNGVWEPKSAKVYKNGTWSELWRGQLYTRGNQWADVTGGFATAARRSTSSSGATASALNVTYNSTWLTISSGSDKAGIFYAKNKINLTGFKTITCTGTFKRGGSTSINLGIGVWSSVPTYYSTEAVAFKGLSGESASTITLDISALSGSYYVGLGLTDSNASVETFTMS